MENHIYRRSLFRSWCVELAVAINPDSMEATFTLCLTKDIPFARILDYSWYKRAFTLARVCPPDGLCARRIFDAAHAATRALPRQLVDSAGRLDQPAIEILHREGSSAMRFACHSALANRAPSKAERDVAKRIASLTRVLNNEQRAGSMMYGALYSAYTELHAHNRDARRFHTYAVRAPYALRQSLRDARKESAQDCILAARRQLAIMRAERWPRDLRNAVEEVCHTIEQQNIKYRRDFTADVLLHRRLRKIGVSRVDSIEWLFKRTELDHDDVTKRVFGY